MKVWMEGKWRKSIPATDRGFLYGDAVFSTMKVTAGVIEYFEEHLQELLFECAAIHILPPPIEKRVIDSLLPRKGIWRLKIVVTGGDLTERSLAPRKGRVVVLLEEAKIKEGVLTLSFFSSPIVVPHAKLKTLSALSRLYIAEEARLKGVDDLIVLSPEGYVLETGYTNIFWREKGILCTPDPALPLLFGTTLQRLIREEKEVRFVKVRAEELPSRLYCCSSIQGIKECRIKRM